MCTVLFQRETLPAEIRSTAKTQKIVDELISLEKSIKEGIEEADNLDSFNLRGFGIGDYPKDIYVWFDCACFGNGKKGFYYIRNRPMRAHWNTSYFKPAYIIEKSKLTPSQIDFMERKCKETEEDAVNAQQK